MFNTTLTHEYQQAASAFGLGAEALEQFSLRALRASLLSEADRLALERRFTTDFARLRAEHLNG